MNLYQIIGALGTLCGLIFGYYAFKISRKKEDQQTGIRDGTLLTEIGYIKGGVDDIKRQQERQAEQNLEVVSRLTAVEESTKSAHHRLDTFEVRTRTGKGEG